MSYSDLIKKEQNHLSGKIGKYMDDYVRRNQLWNPKQMFEDFMLYIGDEISQGLFTIFLPGQDSELSMERAVKWLTTPQGKELVMSRMIKKYEKDADIANKKKPIIERVFFGKKWSKSEFYMLNYGMKTMAGYIPMDAFKRLSDIPWSNGFFNKELKRYNKTLKDVIIQLSESHLEKRFYEYWLDRFYKSEFPALIPEICGFRGLFYYYEFIGNNYGTWDEIPGTMEEKWGMVKNHNFRYDFGLINYKRQKICFIELDGFENHKSRLAQTIDSIKRNHAMKLNCTLFNFTSKRINEDIDSVFKKLEPFIN